MIKSDKISYKITSDTSFLDEQNAITPQISKEIERFYKLALKGKKSSVPKFLEIIEKYPDTPQFKNYLSVLYNQLGETEKLYETNHWLIAEHPDYLFGKINLANEYYLEGEFHKMPDVLGEHMDLQLLYPNRDTFHVSEVLSFMQCAISYYTAIDDIEQAEICLDVITELAPDTPEEVFARHKIMLANLESGVKWFDEEQEDIISVKTKQQEISTKENPPVFIHKEIELIYNVGLFIDEDDINKILSLPRETLIRDLETVLQDSIDRFGYFSNLVNEDVWYEDKMSFLVHAVFFLGEIEAHESIDAIFNILSQSEEYLDLYFGDFITAAIWEPIYKIVNNHLDKCYQFMITPGIYTFSKTAIGDALEQIVHHQSDRRNEVISWYRDVINYFLQSEIEDNIIDSEVIGLMICNIMDFNGAELLPEIDLLFEKEYVSEDICGDYNYVKKEILKSGSRENKREILSLSDRYNQITTTWAGYQEDDSEFEKSYLENYLPQEPIRVEHKIGRNDPCPCGSGKKYKKCCMNK